MIYIIIGATAITIILVFAVRDMLIKKRDRQRTAERIEGAVKAHITILSKKVLEEDAQYVGFDLTLKVLREDGSSYTVTPKYITFIRRERYRMIKKDAEYDVWLRPGHEHDFMFENEYQILKEVVE